MKNSIRQARLKRLIQQYKAAGHTAFHYPRKKEISLDGGKSLTECEAIQKMKDVLLRTEHVRPN